MEVSYSQITEMIETGDTSDSMAKKKILEMNKRSLHKRMPIPKYTFERKNFLL